MVVFGSFLEELEARTAIEDCLKRFARAVDMVTEPMAEPPSFPPEFTVQKHGLDDPLYRLRN